MQYFFYMLIFVAVVSVATGLINSIFFPFIAIKESELPAAIRRKLADYFPELLPKVVKQQRARQQYLIDGKLGKRPVRITVVVTPESEINSVEMVATPKESFVSRNAIEHSQVPSQVASRFLPFLAGDQTSFQSRKAVAGLIGNQNAYRIEFDTEKSQYRIDITHEGELFRFHKKTVA